MDNPKRARGWKQRIQPRVDLKVVAPVPYSTPFFVLTQQISKKVEI